MSLHVILISVNYVWNKKQDLKRLLGKQELCVEYIAMILQFYDKEIQYERIGLLGVQEWSSSALGSWEFHTGNRKMDIEEQISILNVINSKFNYVSQ